MPIGQLIDLIRRKWRERYDRVNHRLGTPGRDREQDRTDASQINLIREVNRDMDAIAEWESESKDQGNGENGEVKP